MKNIIDICRMTQPEVKKYAEKFLRSKGYRVESGDGFVFGMPRKINNEARVMLVAHMDTVHKTPIKTIEKTQWDDGLHISSPEGIGGDDRCGIWCIMDVITKGRRPTVLLCEDEECGNIGASKFIKSKICTDLKGINALDYMIEIDRRGNNDCVFYSNDNKEFQKWIQDETPYKFSYGSCSDISALMPALGVAGVNFSAGYNKEHTTSEYIVQEDMEETARRVCELIGKNCPKPFKYEPKKYSYPTYYGGGCYDEWEDYEYNFRSQSMQKSPSKKAQRDKDSMVRLRVSISEYYDEMCPEMESYGTTKDQAWKNLFFDNPDLCFDAIADYAYD